MKYKNAVYCVMALVLLCSGPIGAGCKGSKKKASPPKAGTAMRPKKADPPRKPLKRSQKSPSGAKAMTVTDWTTLLGAVKTLCQLKTLTTATIETMFGAPVKKESDHPGITFYESKVSKGVIDKVDLRIKDDGSAGFISLSISAKADRVALAKGAKALGTPIRPHIVSPGLGSKPDWEYKYSHEFKMEGLEVNLGYEDRKGKTELVYVAIEWKRR